MTQNKRGLDYGGSFKCVVSYSILLALVVLCPNILRLRKMYFTNAIQVIVSKQSKKLSEDWENFIIRNFNICNSHPIIYSCDKLEKNTRGEYVGHVGGERCVKAFLDKREWNGPLKLIFKK